MQEPTISYLSLGSNLGDRQDYLQRALFLIQEKTGSIHRISKVYQTASWGFESADFLNCCISLETSLSPIELLEVLLDIERFLGREREQTASYTARTIDIDILYFGQEVINTDALTIPHPQLHLRRFVLKPLADIAPQFYHPVLKKDSRNLLQECRDKIIPFKTPYRLFKDRSALFTGLNFIAIEGNIGAGKTTLARKIAADFNAKLVLERFADNAFLPKFYEDQARYAFPLEMSFLADRFQQFTDDTTQFDLFRQFMVSDYDIYKSLIFAKITLPPDEFSLYRRLFNFMYQEVKKPRIYVYLYQTTERLLDNIKKRGRDYEQKISADYLDKINRGYFDFIRSYPEQNNLVLDLSERDFVGKKEDYEFILGEIQKFASGLTF
ncbi:2-amino-4-hydroxy-6-hydroxymethyldihydropteridine diphosphokinase [Poritiphilus flavus]|uniref:2-amino-4-hydroxy-6-hydroxymethyldihydropteridine pyrophosphokinase n=1 Tax=Poritiphilus flavus TaxID=2697053 RepID=A0A6L9EH05_9FLAO|nr:2-amino-4-hydroxy-6-hydroxymethyldihydropteridine diphosphokinase [Poritiphilus flavus]NAS13902.1 2-amino-4-hydroxy-6-hydroxymethyldihydropteridine diphosphokinase [Poritiphilus flavus]